MAVDTIARGMARNRNPTNLESIEFYDGFNKLGIFQNSGGEAGSSMGFYYGYTGATRNTGMLWSYDHAAGVSILKGVGTNRFSIESDAAIVHIAANSHYEWEGDISDGTVDFIGYKLGTSIGKTINISNVGQTTYAVPLRVTAVDAGGNIQDWYQGSAFKALISQNGEYGYHNAYTSSTNYERLTMGASPLGANRFGIFVSTGASGTYRNLDIGSRGASGVTFFTNDILHFYIGADGHLNWANDNQIDIGTNGQRPRDLRVGRNVHFGGLPTANPAVAGQLWNDAGTLKVSAG